MEPHVTLITVTMIRFDRLSRETVRLRSHKRWSAKLKLPPEVLAMSSCPGRNYRYFINNRIENCRIPDPGNSELGGLTLCSAIYWQ